MKSNIITFIISILLYALFLFIIIESTINKKNIIKKIEQINYYEKAYEKIQNEIDDYIVNREVKKTYQEYFSKEIIKEDIKKIINNEEINRNDDLYKIISKHTTDTKIRDKYTNEINNIYTSNLFPIKEYKIINKLYLTNNQKIFIILVLIILLTIFSLLLYLINKNLQNFKIALISSGLDLIVTYLLLSIINIKNFIYTNEYYTKILKMLINNFKNKTIFIGILIIFTYIVNKLKNKNKITC